MNITLEAFKALFPTNKNPQAWVDGLNAQLPLYAIDTKQRVAAFLGICGHETGGFVVLEENLNYSAQGLANTWPARYAIKGKDGKPIKPYKPSELAYRLHRQPEKIANNCYADRMGNGSELSGEGWKYRGRGVIQTTGKGNYKVASLKIFKDNRLLTQPELLVQPEYAIASACVFWQKAGCNTPADKGDMLTVTKLVNGGTIGLEERKALYQKALTVL